MIGAAWAGPHVIHLATDSNDQGGLAPGGRAVLRRAFERLGWQVQFEPLPLRRSLPMSVQGQLDGEALRISAVAEKHRELLLVPGSISVVEVWAYVGDSGLKPNDWDKLVPLRVGYPRGVVLLEKMLAAVPRKHEATTSTDALRLLRKDVVDVALLTLAAGQPGLSPDQLAGLHRLEKPLNTTHLYLLLHQRHAGLIPALSEVLRAMEASGESARLRARAWAQLAIP